MYIEQYNGTSWSNVATLQQVATGWQSLSGYLLDAYTSNSGQSVVKFRFRAESGGNTYDFVNDLLVDDIYVINKCIAPTTNLSSCNNTATYCGPSTAISIFPYTEDFQNTIGDEWCSKTTNRLRAIIPDDRIS